MINKKGRKSAGDKEALAKIDAIVVLQRPDPPSELSDEMAVEWCAVVDRMPGGWFPRETWGVLAQYCRHRVAANRVAQLLASLEAGDELDIEVYDKALKMQERQSSAIASLATKMRLTQQSTLSAGTKKPADIGDEKEPWE